MGQRMAHGARGRAGRVCVREPAHARRAGGGAPWAGLDGQWRLVAIRPNAAGGAARRMTVRTSEKAQAKRDMRARVSGGGPGVLARRGASRRPRCSFIFTPRHKLGWGGRGPGPPPRASGGVGGEGSTAYSGMLPYPTPRKTETPVGVERTCARRLFIWVVSSCLLQKSKKT